MTSEQRREDDERHRRGDEVERPLDRQPDGPIRAADERVDGRPVELLHLAGGEGVVEDVHRDAHDLALLLGQVGDRVDEAPLAERQADRDLVDDALVEQRLDVLEAAQDGPSSPCADRRLVVDEADDSQPELAVGLDLRGERLASWTGAGDEDEPGVAALRREAGGTPSRRIARVPSVTRYWVGNSTTRKTRLMSGSLNQNRTLSVTSAMSAVARRQVARLRADRPAGPWAVQAVDGESCHPAGAVHDEERHRVGDDLAPPDRPIGAEADERQPDEDERRQRPVGEHEQGAEPGSVSAKHVAASLGGGGASAQWYRGPSARSQPGLASST